MPARQGSVEEPAAQQQEATVIPNQESLIGDLLSMDIGSTAPAAPVSQPTSNVDLLVYVLWGIRFECLFICCLAWRSDGYRSEYDWPPRGYIWVDDGAEYALFTENLLVAGG